MTDVYVTYHIYTDTDNDDRSHMSEPYHICVVPGVTQECSQESQRERFASASASRSPTPLSFTSPGYLPLSYSGTLFLLAAEMACPAIHTEAAAWPL